MKNLEKISENCNKFWENVGELGEKYINFWENFELWEN